MDRIKLWPHGALIIAGVAVGAAIAAGLWFKYERTAEASGLPNAARIERMDGQVGVNRSLDNSNNSQWIEARPNTPVGVGDRIYTKENSTTQIAFTGRNAATIDPNTSIDILDLSRDRTQVALRSGSAMFDVGSIASGQLFEVATPCGAVDLNERGIYEVAIDQNGNAEVTAFSGSAQLVGQGGRGTVRKGEVLTVSCQEASAGTISRVDYEQAGTYLDNHFRGRYPKRYDGRYRNYDTYLNDPYSFDPYQDYSSYKYVSDYIPGVYELDDYGSWQNVNDYGYCWHPNVASGWAPYQSGYWEMDYPYGLTWVSNEPWGYAPYHYGRWANVSNEWYWVPESTNVYPSYSPALTAFIPLGGSSVGWVPLGPGDPYVSRYYDNSWQPVYLTSPTVTQRFININVPGAVTVIPQQSFGQVIYSNDAVRFDPRAIAQVQPVLDPLSVNQLRQAAFDTRRAERRFDMSQAVAQRLNSTPVVAANMPVAPRFRRDLPDALRVQALPGKAKRQDIQLRDQRAASAPQPQAAPNLVGEQARERQLADLARQAGRGDRGAKQQMQELRRQQFQQGRVDGVATPQAQGARVAQPAKPAQDQKQAMREQRQAQREAARQQTLNNRQQQKDEAPRGQNRESRQSQPAFRPQPAPQRQPETRPNVKSQRPQEQPRVMSAPRQQQLRPPQARPQVERRGPPAQAQPRAMPQPQVQRQGQPKGQGQGHGKGEGKQGGGKPGKKP